VASWEHRWIAQAEIRSFAVVLIDVSGSQGQRMRAIIKNYFSGYPPFRALLAT
jgi:hypothetical protein